jgi:hypothetical protein
VRPDIFPDLSAEAVPIPATRPSKSLGTKAPPRNLDVYTMLKKTNKIRLRVEKRDQDKEDLAVSF